MNMFKFLLGLLGAVSTGVMALDREACYDRGSVFKDTHPDSVPDVYHDIIIDFCVNLAMPVDEWKMGQTVSRCYPDPEDNSLNLLIDGHKVNMEVKNEAHSKQSLTADECVWAMRWLILNCFMGGSGNHNGFHFTLDPLEGNC